MLILQSLDNRKIVGYWILIGVGMLIIQVLLGGITRLTGSGLSMTDWKPIMDTLPPLNHTEWMAAFDAYKEIGQFKYLNADFTLSDFKFIYFWEWFHRNWARLILIAFIIPFCFFLYKRLFKLSDIPKLLLLMGGGIALGIIGKIMVFSGLNDSNLYVGHIELAMHFTGAQLLIALTFWVGLQFIIDPNERKPNTKLAKLSLLIIALLGIQFVFGAFMAGLKAATAAATWPSINGEMLPTTFSGPIAHDKIAIHFIHRGLGYLIFLLTLMWTFFSRKTIKIGFEWLPLILVILQVLLGIASLLYSTKAVRNGFGPFEWSAQIHQIVAMLLLLSLVWHYFMRRKIKI